MSAIDDLLKKVKPATASVELCLRGDLLGDIDLIDDELDRLKDWEPESLSDADPRKALEARRRELQDQMAEESQIFRFQSVGDKTWSDLLAEHPAPEGSDGKWDPQTYPAALVAASSVEPKMSVEDVERLFDAFNMSQRNTLFSAAWSANQRGVDIPFSQGSFDVGASTAKS